MNRILHFHRRLGFGLPLDEPSWDLSLDQHLAQALGAQHLALPIPLLPAEGLSNRAANQAERAALLRLMRDWLGLMARNDGGGMREKIAWFWHGHFACLVRKPQLAHAYIEALRQNALGKFGDLLLAVAQSGAMIRYLNNQQNRKDRPNENFARELLELFTLGQGQYSENDIKEAARAFTGWTSHAQTGAFIFQEKRHDKGLKTFLGQTGPWRGEDILRIILEQEHLAQHLAKRIYRFFVDETQENSQHQGELAQVLRQSHYDLKACFRYLAEAEWFYQPKLAGRIYKSPVQLVVEYQKMLKIQWQEPKLLFRLLRRLGQVPCLPPNVGGWPAGQAWFDHSSLLLRLDLPRHLTQQAAKRTGKISLDWTGLLAQKDPNQILSRSLSSQVLKDFEFQGGKAGFQALWGLPEFQLA